MKTNEFDFWLSLFQTSPVDLSEDERRQLMAELENVLNDPGKAATWNVERLRPPQFNDLLFYLQDTFMQMQIPEKPVEGSYTVHERWTMSKKKKEGPGFEYWTDTANLRDTCTARFIKAWREVGVQPDQIKKCKTCENMFVQHGKREKVFCSTKCRIDAANLKRKKEAEEHLARVVEEEDRKEREKTERNNK